MFLMASVAGLPLYLRLVWEPLDDEFVLDMAKYGAPRAGKIVHKCLLRKPNVRATAIEEK